MIQVIENLQINLDPAPLAKSVMLNNDQPEYNEFAEYCEKIAKIAKPFTLLRKCKILTKNSNNQITTDAGIINSSLVAECCKNQEYIYSFISSSGTDVENFIPDNDQDPLVAFWIDFLKGAVMEIAFNKAKEKIKDSIGNKVPASLIPANESSWELSGLKDIFNIFPKEILKKYHLTLSNALFMQPSKTRAGIFIITDKESDVCKFCELRNCHTCPNHLRTSQK